jgi:hypothetical protein
VGVGSGEGLGKARIVGDGFGVVWTSAAGPPHPASTVSDIRLAAKRWEMAIRPERGGRITSLRLDGEELLDQGIGVDQPTAEGFVEGGAWGWDEMVPNVAATASLPDHGEAWRHPWETVAGGVMRVAGRAVPFVLERKVELGDSVRLGYRYLNAGAEPHRPFWCAHPCFKLEPGMELPVAMPAPGASTKVVLPPGSTGSIRLRWRKAAIEMSWDPSLTPYLAVWVCNGDLGGYCQVAIEPALGGNEIAEPDGRPLAPGARLEWWLRIDPL